MWDPYADFVKTVLPNGLTVYATEWPGREWEAIGFIVHSGSKEDPDDLVGLSHLLEHMVIDNACMPESEIKDFFRSTGGWFESGTTGIFSSDWSFCVPLQEEILAKSVSILGSMLLESDLEKNLEGERQTVIREFNNKYSIELFFNLRNAKREAIFHGAPAFKKLPVGHPDNFARMTREDLRRFYGEHYVPANMSIVAVGGMRPQEIFNFLEKSVFGIERAGKRNPPLQPQKTAPHPSEIRRIVNTSEFSSVKLNCWTYDSNALIPGILEDAFSIFRPILSDTLFKELREERGWVYGAHMNSEQLVECINFQFETKLPLNVGIEEAEVVIENCIRQAVESREPFEESKEMRIAQLRLVDVSGSAFLDNCIGSLGRRQRIFTNTEDIADYEKVSFEQFQELALWLDPKHRYTLISVE